MTFEEAKKIFLNRGYIEVPGGTYYDADKWRESITVISEWLEQEPCEDCISRKDMLAVLSQSHSLTQAWDGFEKLPSVTPKEKAEYKHDHEVVKAYNDGQAYILDKINTEIKETANKIRNIRNDNLCFFTEQDVLEIIEKYREVSE